MRALNWRRNRVAVRAALLGSAVLTALAIGGVTASGASAGVSCEGSNITGEGASLQQIAQQQVWAPGFEGVACEGVGPTVSFVPSGSGTGLAQWSAFGGTTINHERQFLATTMAPTAAQMANIRSATRAQNTRGEQAEVAVVPVAQAAVAIVANPPAGCTITNIKREALERVFKGGKKEWSDLPNASGHCNSPITRVVPSEVAGTTYQLKHYLSLINGEPLACLTAPNDTWAALQDPSLNTTWPEACKGHGGVTPVKHSLKGGTGTEPGSSGADEIATVNATPGSIGFAGLPDAETTKAGSTVVLSLQNGNKLGELGGAATYASPVAEGNRSNCGAATYAVPTAAQLGKGSGLNADWSAVYGSALESPTYPLCTLTFDIALEAYENAGFTEADAISVKDFLYWYMLAEAAQGQTEIDSAGKWYAKLPTTGTVETNVRNAARFTASKIE
jgi:hypothetical protein